MRALRAAAWVCAALLCLEAGEMAAAQAPVPEPNQNVQAGPGVAEPSSSTRPGPRKTRPGRRDPKSNLPISRQLTQNPALVARLESLLPAGANLEQAAEGFTSLEEFVAAVHVAHNLDISLAEMRNAKNRRKPLALAAVIHKQNPNVNARLEEQRALKAARQDLRELPPPEAPVEVGHR